MDQSSTHLGAPGTYSSGFSFGLSLPWLLEEQNLSSELRGAQTWCCRGASAVPSETRGAAEAKGSSKLLSTVLWLCGMERRQEGAEPLPRAEPLPVVSLEEEPLVKHILNINLLLCVCAGIFLWAYFA
ncbi:hypothetical protein EK904_000775 [Melospiza melodia maxima]|nr:hypothetical protein EK904_000775 [Melospiza melodia maxima]